MTSQRIRKSLSFLVLLTTSTLAGGARGCFGDPTPPISLAADAGTDAGVGDVDMHVAADLGTSIDMGVDAGAHSPTWETVFAGHTDNDFNNPLAFDSTGDAHILADWESEGGIIHLRLHDGTWTATTPDLDASSFGMVTCALNASMAIDASDVVHIAFKATSAYEGGGCSSDRNASNLIRYATITDDVPSAPITLRTASSLVGNPSIAVDPAGTAHVVYGEQEDGMLHYVSVTAGVATTPIAIEGTLGAPITPFHDTANVSRVLIDASGAAVVVYRTGGTIHKTVLSGAMAGTTSEIATSGTLRWATIDARTGTLHVLATGPFDPTTDSYSSYFYMSVSSTGVASAPETITSTSSCHDHAELAVSSSGEIAFVCGVQGSLSGGHVGAEYSARTGTTWSPISELHGPEGFEGVAPSAAFDSDNILHVALQNSLWGSANWHNPHGAYYLTLH